MKFEWPKLKQLYFVPNVQSKTVGDNRISLYTVSLKASPVSSASPSPPPSNYANNTCKCAVYNDVFVLFIRRKSLSSDRLIMLWFSLSGCDCWWAQPFYFSFHLLFFSKVPLLCNVCGCTSLLLDSFMLDELFHCLEPVVQVKNLNNKERFELESLIFRPTSSTVLSDMIWAASIWMKTGDGRLCVRDWNATRTMLDRLSASAADAARGFRVAAPTVFAVRRSGSF